MSPSTARIGVLTKLGVEKGYKPPYEDTDTVVLTSPKSQFVDIRFPRKRRLGRPVAEDPSFWAFCGTSTVTFLDGDDISMPFAAHCTWEHELDSKGTDAVDEGDLFLLPNGDCVEVGIMERPGTGKVELYKEYWSAASPTSENGHPAAQSTPCVVVKMVVLSDDVRGAVSGRKECGGVVIRVGDFCQGIMHQSAAAPGDGNAVWVERWIRGDLAPGVATDVVATIPRKVDGADWHQDWRSNTPSDDEACMPCMWACAVDRKLGDEIVLRGNTWKVVEALKDTARP